jgi:hypothetical protein
MNDPGGRGGHPPGGPPPSELPSPGKPPRRQARTRLGGVGEVPLHLQPRIEAMPTSARPASTQPPPTGLPRAQLPTEDQGSPNAPRPRPIDSHYMLEAVRADPQGDGPGLVVVVTHASGRERTEVFRGTEVSIGRDRTSDLVLTGDGISRRHAVITLGDSGGCTIVDLGSTNGTFVNEQPIEHTPTLLGQTDFVTMGEYALRVRPFGDEAVHNPSTMQYDAPPPPVIVRDANRQVISTRPVPGLRADTPHPEPPSRVAPHSHGPQRTASMSSVPPPPVRRGGSDDGPRTAEMHHDDFAEPEGGQGTMAMSVGLGDDDEGGIANPFTVSEQNTRVKDLLQPATLIPPAASPERGKTAQLREVDLAADEPFAPAEGFATAPAPASNPPPAWGPPPISQRAPATPLPIPPPHAPPSHGERRTQPPPSRRPRSEAAAEIPAVEAPPSVQRQRARSISAHSPLAHPPPIESPPVQPPLAPPVQPPLAPPPLAAPPPMPPIVPQVVVATPPAPVVTAAMNQSSLMQPPPPPAPPAPIAPPVPSTREVARTVPMEIQNPEAPPPEPPRAPSRLLTPRPQMTPELAMPESLTSPRALRDMAPPQEAPPSEAPPASSRTGESSVVAGRVTTDSSAALETLLLDRAVTRVVVTVRRVQVERRGGGSPHDAFDFATDNGVERALVRVCDRSGVKFADDASFLRLRLSDGWRLFAVRPPIAAHGHLIELSRNESDDVTLDDLCREKWMSRPMAALAGRLMLARANILIVSERSEDGQRLARALVAAVEAPALWLLSDDDAPAPPGSPCLLLSTEAPAETIGALLELSVERAVVPPLDVAGWRALLEVVRLGRAGVLARLGGAGIEAALERTASALSAGQAPSDRATFRAWLSSSFAVAMEVGRAKDGMPRVLRISELRARAADTVELFRFDPTPAPDGTFVESDDDAHTRAFLGGRGFE